MGNRLTGKLQVRRVWVPTRALTSISMKFLQEQNCIFARVKMFQKFRNGH